MNSDPLAELRGLALPETIGVWPMAIGWWVLLSIIIMLLLVCVYYVRKHALGRRWKKQAKLELYELRSLQKEGIEHNEQILTASSKLFRRVALHIDSREDVAALSGQAWLEKLDQLSHSTEFTQGSGQILADVVWKKPEENVFVQLPSLLDLLERFIKHGKVQHD